MRKSEAKIMCGGAFTGKGLKLMIALAALLLVSACAAFKPTDANGPISNVPQYPVELSDLGTRLEEASVAWYQLSQRYGLPEKTEANLQPYTATLESLPANLPAPIYLPKVGSLTNPTEEEVRESLRRFIVEWQRLIGSDPNQLSLVERIDEPSGVKIARYEQRPFRYPLRGGFGNLVIRFRSNGQLVGFSSNCIPNADRLQATLNGLPPKVTSEQAVNHIKTQAITFTNATGQSQSLTLPPNAVVEARQLVVYAQPSKVPPSGLQIRLAWEVDVTNGPVTKVYLDAISDEIIATS
ncbi:MAG TPA: hypothetical protein VGD61_14870 [Pyrinomonadaceae bacterium]